jgi:hypothetical protein
MKNISGNTYPVKDQIRALGGKWNSALKVWSVPDDKEAEALALVGNSPSRGQERSYKQIHGRCEDAPCCGCCGGNESYSYESYQDRW